MSEHEAEIWYLHVGARAYEQCVLMKPTDTVENLARAIQESSSVLTLHQLTQIQLFLAKPEGGDWLSIESEEVDALMAGDPSTTERMCGRALDRSEILNECFDLENFGLSIRVLVRVRAPTPTETRQKRQRVEDSVKLWCQQIGVPGSKQFKVNIKRTDRVEDLQTLLQKELYRGKIHVWFSMLRLYHAVDAQGQALQHKSPDVKYLRRGDPDALNRWLKHRLDPQMTIGDILKSIDTERYIQVLLLPPVTFVIKEDPEYQQLAQPYRDTAKLLKHAPEVDQLVNIVQHVHAIGVEGKQAVPFVVLEGSSGSGKSQMAFNLMERSEFDLFCVVCGKRDFPVWKSLQFKSAVFLRCVKKDLELVGEAGVVDFSAHVELYTYAFIWAVVSRMFEFTGPRTRDQVLAALEAWRKRQPEGSESRFCVFFLDDYPCLGGSDDPTEREASVRRLRFIRNVFRSVGLVVILSATHAVIRGLLDTVESSSTPNRELWCYVVPLLSRFQDPYLEKLAPNVRTIIECSRPMLAKFALDYVRANPSDTSTTSRLAVFMDKLVRAVIYEFAESRRVVVTDVNAGLVALCGGSAYGLSSLIAGPLSRLLETKPFALWRNRGKAPTKRRHGTTPWTCHLAFAKPENDALMYLCFTGHKGFHELQHGRFIPVRFRDALITAESELGLGKMRQKALVAGAIVAASRWNGFAGTPLGVFLSALLYELGLQTSRDPLIEFPEKIRWLTKFKLPLLVPPTVEWPKHLQSVGLRLELLQQVEKNGLDGLDFVGDAVSVACRLGWCFQSVGDILQNAPKHTRIHVAVINPQTDYDQSFDDEVSKLSWLRHAAFYRISYHVNANDQCNVAMPELVPIPCKATACNEVDCGVADGCKHIDKLVVFLELALS